MEYKHLFDNDNEKPLERMVSNGGFASIFRTIACIGDSLSSGEFESLNRLNEKGYHDYYEYSWGQFMARTLGSKVYNFSRGGMTGVEYVNSYADANDFWNESYLSQAYIIALGVNDLINGRSEIGCYEDICMTDYRKNNLGTFIGTYAYIIARIQEMQPRAKIFLMTIPKENDQKDKIREIHRDILHQFAKMFKNIYIIDLYQYAPVIDQDYMDKFYMGHHLNPMGYKFLSEMIMSYLDYIIRHHYQDFKEVGFIGTELHYYQ